MAQDIFLIKQVQIGVTIYNVLDFFSRVWNLEQFIYECIVSLHGESQHG